VFSEAYRSTIDLSPGYTRGVRRSRPVSLDEFAKLAAFRHALACFLGFSEAAAAAAGLTSRQYQALLALKGYGGSLTIGELADRLRIHHHSAVGLVDRLESLGLVNRTRDPADRRRVRVEPSPKGELKVAQVAAVHRDELLETAATLRALLDPLAASARSGRRRVKSGPAH
jgi:DNA-binding MarR family transcriptional regulator